MCPEPCLGFEDVYRTNVQFVWRSLRRLGVPECDAKDAAQEVFLVVHRKLNEFEGRSKLSRWLFGICLRVASDRRRKASVRHEVLQDSNAIDESGVSGCGLEEAEQRRRTKRLETVLDSIPIEQRAVFVLFELEGMSGVEIADMLDIPAATAHSRLRLAREAFRQGVARLQAQDSFLESRAGGEP